MPSEGTAASATPDASIVQAMVRSNIYPDTAAREVQRAVAHPYDPAAQQLRARSSG